MTKSASPEAKTATGLNHRFALSAVPSAPLVYLVHGRAGDSSVMWTFHRTIAHHCNIIAPEAWLPDPVGGFSWWEVGNGPEKPAEISEAVSRFSSFTAAVERHYALSPTRRVALGFSQGGALLSVVAQREPELLNAIGILAGFVFQVAHRPVAPLPEIFMAHGSQDETISLLKAEQGRDYLKGLGYNLHFVTDRVGHKVGTTGMRELKHWLALMCDQ